MFHLVYHPLLANCSFEKTPTAAILGFEAFIFLSAAIAYLFFSRIVNKLWLRALVTAGGVLIFELFTAPMWDNFRLGVWAYIYKDVSWILTLGWTTLILSVVLAVDRYFPRFREWKRFAISVSILTALTMGLEILVVGLGIRSYAPELMAAISGIQFQGVPIEALYYTPVFIGLIISFYKYWSFAIDDEPLVPLKNRKWVRSFFLTFLAVFLFEFTIEPMVQNVNLPQWSYLYHDISFLMTGAWVLVIGFTAAVVGQFFAHFPTVPRFAIAVAIASSLAFPIETWYIKNGLRIYGESAAHNFSGILTPVSLVPIEVAFAIPFYMALIIAFVRYWETVIDNRL